MDFSALSFEDQPYALKAPAERRRRLAMRRLPHVKPLSHFVDGLSAQHPDYQLPDFDPCDGGSEARVLLLLQAPGRKAIESGFVSRNNPDPTARNLCELLYEAGIARRDTVIWNVVPWYIGEENHIRAVMDGDLCESVPQLQPLLTLLPQLQHVVLEGVLNRETRK